MADDTAKQLEALAKLREDGVLTDEEFAAKRSTVLRSEQPAANTRAKPKRKPSKRVRTGWLVVFSAFILIIVIGVIAGGGGGSSTSSSSHSTSASHRSSDGGASHSFTANGPNLEMVTTDATTTTAAPA